MLTLEEYQEIRKRPFVEATLEDLNIGDIINIRTGIGYWIFIYDGLMDTVILTKDNYYFYMSETDEGSVTLGGKRICDIESMHSLKKYIGEIYSFGY